MEKNKIIVNGETLIDLTQDTVSADKVLKDVTFHLPDGSAGVGTYEDGGGGGGDEFVPVKDGNTHVWITIPEDVPENQKEFQLQLTASEDGGTVIDWGDNNTTTTSGTALTCYNHTYSTPGDYHIILHSTAGDFTFGTSAYNPKYTGYIYGTFGWNCDRIINIEIGNDVRALTQRAFKDCHNLRNVYCSGTPTINYQSTELFQNCYSLTNVVLPDSLSQIQSYMFDHCISLKNITPLPGHISTGSFQYSGIITMSLHASYGLKDNAFSHCYNLDTITFESSTGNTSIGETAFQECIGLTKLTIPANITSIKKGAFADCINMEECHFLGTTPPTLSETASTTFANHSSTIKLYVPAESVAAYKTDTNWASMADYIFAEPTT